MNNTKRKKVLFFLFGGCGGAERMTINIGKTLPHEEYEVKFVVCGRDKKILDFIPSKYAVIRIPWHNIYVFPRLRIGMVIFMEKPDMVFSSSTGLNIRLLQVAKFLNVRCIVRHDNMIQYFSAKAQRAISKYYRFAYRVIAQQEEMQHDLIKLTGTDDKHIVCLHNPVDVATIQSKIDVSSPYPKDGSINYLWVGNYLPSKGHDVLAEAFKIVHSRNHNTHLYFVGQIVESFPNYIKTKKIVEEAGISDYVHFMGYQSNPYQWMKYCDCFVLPSRIEGLPNVLLEAMYLGRPVVATLCIPVIDRMVKEGYNGYKVQPEQPEEMAKAMEKALHLRNFKCLFEMASPNNFKQLFNYDI